MGAQARSESSVVLAGSVSELPRPAGVYARLWVRTYVDLMATESIYGGAPRRLKSVTIG